MDPERIVKAVSICIEESRNKTREMAQGMGWAGTKLFTVSSANVTRLPCYITVIMFDDLSLLLIAIRYVDFVKAKQGIIFDKLLRFYYGNGKGWPNWQTTCLTLKNSHSS